MFLIFSYAKKVTDLHQKCDLERGDRNELFSRAKAHTHTHIHTYIHESTLFSHVHKKFTNLFKNVT